MIGVAIQPIEILPRTPRLRLRADLARPIPITAPTTACELEIGTIGIRGRCRILKIVLSSDEEKIKRTSDVDNTTRQAVIGESL